MSAMRKSSSPLAVVVVVLLLASQASRAHPLYQDPMDAQPGPEKSAESLVAAASEEQPMVHNNNYDMIMPDYYDQHPAESMHYQNFEEFYDPNMTGANEYKMDESQFLGPAMVRAPQPLSPAEQRMRRRPAMAPAAGRQMVMPKMMMMWKPMSKPMKGATKPRGAFVLQPGMMQKHRFA